jgi:ubiquinone biosynthesis protein
MDVLLGWNLVISLLAILLIAWLAGRLLGVSRSWGASALAGLTGWLGALALSLAIGKGDTDAPGFTRNLWVFAIVFTMSSSVWIEMLAKPGTLARAQSGLVRLPRPIRALRRSGQRIGRYAQITRIAAKYGFGPALGLGHPDAGEEVAPAAPAARRLRLALEECGGMFVKLGQLLSTRADLLPAAVTAELARLQDRVAPAPAAEVRELLEAELGRSVEEVFGEFDWEPIAAASIGQAYRARLPGGEPVIVKVQRPGIAAAVERDLLVLAELARAVETRTSWAGEYRVSELADEFAERLREELDFRLEARNASEIAANLAGMPQVRIPTVHQELSSARVLVLEWLDGVSIREVERIDRLGLARPALAEALLRCALQQMLIDGRFHADPHPGNVLVLPDGQLGLIDFGATGRLDPLQQASMRGMLVAVQRRDAGMLRQAVLEVATLRRNFDDEQLERALARFMARHLGSGAAPDAAMFNDLLQLFFTFGIVLPVEFSTFFRALVTLEGTLTTLFPGYLVIQAAEELAAGWARERLAPSSLDELARNELASLALLLRRVPKHVDRIAGIVERGDLRTRVSLFGDEQDLRAVTRLLNRVVLAVLGSVVGVLSVMLLGTQGGPPFTGDTSLFQFFGYFGLFCATVLILRVIVAVLHDGVN